MKLTRRVGLVVVPPVAIMIAAAVVYSLAASSNAAPLQPIAFSHRLHADEKEIACVYCHQGVAKSPTAGIPSVERCMGCHRTIAVDKPEVRKLADYWQKREPIAWARLAYVPDHVYFTHEQHVASGLECRACHGVPNAPGGSFARLQPGMGWCLDCHRRNSASTDCAACHK